MSEEQIQTDSTAVVQSNTVENKDKSQPSERALNRTESETVQRLKEVSEEAKTQRQRNVELRKRNDELEKLHLAKMAEQGQYKEIAEISQKKAQEVEEQAKKLRQAFAYKAVTNAVEIEATKLGAKNVDDVIQLINLDQIPIDEVFNVDTNSVKTIMEEFKKNKDYLFAGKPGPKIADLNPTKTNAPDKININKLNQEQLEKLLLEQHGKKG